MVCDCLRSGSEVCQLRLEIWAWETNEGGRVHSNVAAVLADPIFRYVVKKGFERVEVLLSEWVVLVIVTAGAVEGLSEPNGCGGFDSIGGVFREELICENASFFVEHVVSMETGGNALIEGRVGEEVACELFNGELVERHVFVEGTNHPIAPRPEFAVAIDLVAV